MKIVATIEARMTSSRLPGKVLMPAGKKPLLQILIERLKQVKELDQIVLATTINTTDDPVAQLGKDCGIEVFRGSENDVLSRVCGALRQANADVCVEITGDCPLVDPALISHALAEFLQTADRHPYLSNSDEKEGVPAGQNIQIFKCSALYQLDEQSTDPLDREHVSYGFYRPESNGIWNPRFISQPGCEGKAGLLMTLDYREDYDLLKAMYEELHSSGSAFGIASMIGWMELHPEMQLACRKVRQMEEAV